MKLAQDAVIFIENAKPVGDYRIELKFSDGASRTVDFGPFLKQSSNPMIRAYLEPTAFARFSIKDGDLVWDDYDLCFSIADLYEANI